MGLNVGYLTSDTTSKGDEIYTPFYAVEPIIKYIPKDKTIWCPFDEEWSAFYQMFTGEGFKVVRSSLAEGKDFFTYEPKQWDILVSNPPFSLKDDILKRVYSFSKPFALLLPLNTLQGVKRYPLFKKGIQVLSFDKRVSYHKDLTLKEVQKGSPFASAYFCRDLLPKDLIIEELRC